MSSVGCVGLIPHFRKSKYTLRAFYPTDIKAYAGRFLFIVEHIPSWADAGETNTNEIAPKLRRNFTSMMLDYLCQNANWW